MASSLNAKRKKRQQKAKTKKSFCAQEPGNFSVDEWLDYKIGKLNERISDIKNNRRSDIFIFSSVFFSSLLVSSVFFKISNFEFSSKCLYFIVLSMVGLSGVLLLLRIKLPIARKTIGIEFTETLIRKTELKLKFRKQIHVSIIFSLIGFGILFNGGIFSKEQALGVSDIMIWIPIITILSFLMLYIPIKSYRQELRMINL